eukprot:CAMPEP_0170601802 /NCGR_PEP_ID=MMETSP0224-20130122/18051_1 /TAXON_ID=285029 /ORGANISM="Togula jolla, Strain CCCM 725" /LENGTH=499 /DNA_ID=CAMNT_0010926597 /DNA_START=210 /DNA_END=1710 /DNA_ORIENTATION=+
MRADTFFGITILLNAAFIGIEIEVSDGSINWGLWSIESLFLVIFIVEIFLRMRAEMPNILKFFDRWGIFDFSVTLVGCCDTWVVTPFVDLESNSPMSSFTVLRVFRLVRLVRLIRVLRMFSELVILVQTIGNSIRAVAWMSLLLSIIMYTGSIITVLLIGHPNAGDPDVDEYFGDIGSALFSHFCVVTLEGWPDIATTAMRHHRLWAVYFIAMIVLTNFALVNLMVGVIVERIINLSLEQEKELESFMAESEQFRHTLQTLFDSAVAAETPSVTRADVRKLLEYQSTREIMDAFGINLGIPPQVLHTIMDLNRDGVTSFQEFFDACLRMCGTKQSVHSVFLQHDICVCQNTIEGSIRNLEERLSRESALAPTLEEREPPQPEVKPAPKSEPHQQEESFAAASLLKRMEKFGLVQQQMLAEMHALRKSLVPKGGTLRARDGTEMGPCCMEGLLFSKLSDEQDPLGEADGEPERDCFSPVTASEPTIHGASCLSQKFQGDR